MSTMDRAKIEARLRDIDHRHLPSAALVDHRQMRSTEFVFRLAHEIEEGAGLLEIHGDAV